MDIDSVMGALKEALKSGHMSRKERTEPDPVVERIKQGEFMWPEDEVILGEGFVMIKKGDGR
jgi:hypothetical protein